MKIPPRWRFMHRSALQKELLNRLSIIDGQVKGVRKMVKTKQSKRSIFLMLLAVEGALKKTIHEIFKEVLKKEIVYEVNRLEEDENILPKYAERLDSIRKNVHRYSLAELVEACEELEKLKAEKED